MVACKEKANGPIIRAHWLKKPNKKEILYVRGDRLLAYRVSRLTAYRASSTHYHRRIDQERRRIGEAMVLNVKAFFVDHKVLLDDLDHLFPKPGHFFIS